MLPTANRLRLVTTLLAGVIGASAFDAIAADATQPATQPAPTVIVPATIEPFEQADLFAKTLGYVSEVKADIGDHLKAGQVLAVIDSPELASELVAAEATLTAKREITNAAKSAVDQATTALRVAKSQLAAYQSERKLAETTFKRQEQLFGGQAVTEQQLDDARTKTELAQSQADVGDAKVAAAEADVRAAEANQAVAAAQVGVAEAEVTRLKAMVAYTRITAPFDGVVSRRLANRGDLAQAGTGSRTAPLFTLQRMDTVRVMCEVPETSAARVTRDSAAVIKVYGAESQTVEGKVTRFAKVLNPETRTMRTEIDVPNADEKLRPGMYAQVTLTLRPATQPVTQPTTRQ